MAIGVTLPHPPAEQSINAAVGIDREGTLPTEATGEETEPVRPPEPQRSSGAGQEEEMETIRLPETQTIGVHAPGEVGVLSGRRRVRTSYGSHRFVPQKAGCCKRCAIGGRRCIEKEHRGFTTAQVLALLITLALPLLDAGSDWIVVIRFYLSEDYAWFKAGLAINIVGGLAAAFVLDLAMQESLDIGPIKAFLPSLVLGLVGLSPAALAALTLYTQKAVRLEGEDGIKLLKAAEVVFEALPQSVLQGYVGISYGRLDPSDAENFDLFLMGSLGVSLLGAGATMFSWEFSNRGDGADPFLSRYGLLRVLACAAQTATLVLWVSLLTCAQKALAAIAMVAVVALFLFLSTEGASRKKARSDALEMAVLSLLCVAVVAGSMATVFYNHDHLPNNYANDSATVGEPGDPQHYDCKDRTSGVYAAMVASAAAVLLTPLSWLFDADIGAKRCRAVRWSEQLAKDSKGKTEEQLHDLKIAAIWRWADVFEDGTLEPREVYRLASKMLETDSDGGTPRRRHEAYVQLCKWVGIPSLSLNQLMDREPWPADQRKENFTLSEEQFRTGLTSDIPETKLVTKLAKSTSSSYRADRKNQAYTNQMFRTLRVPLVEQETFCARLAKEINRAF